MQTDYIHVRTLLVSSFLLRRYKVSEDEGLICLLCCMIHAKKTHFKYLLAFLCSFYLAVLYNLRTINSLPPFGKQPFINIEYV